MKPPPFQYVRPGSVDEAIALLDDDEQFAKVLAGGQSLVPMMNFRLARPDVLVDLACLPELSGISAESAKIRVGPMTSQRELEMSDEVHEVCPLFREALRHVGHQQTRSRGTVGGSIAHADPAAELPAIAIALDAELTARSPDGTRTIKAEEFYEGPYTTVLEDSEILTDITFSVPVGTRTGFTEFTRRAGDFALGGVVVALRSAGDPTVIDDARVAVFGVGATPLRLQAVEDVLRSDKLTAELADQAGDAASDAVSPIASHGASEEYRRRLIGVLVRRVLKEMMK